jgi:phospholipase A1
MDSIWSENMKRTEDRRIYVRNHLDMTEEQAVKLIDRMPSFAVYEDTYFVIGGPLNKNINSNTADATFQLSIRQRLTQSILPFNTFLYLTYTQRSFWDIFAESSPFRDTNYNPGVGLGKYLIHNNKLMGGAFVQLEHQSNGRDGLESRSWNFISLTGKYFFNMRLSLKMQVWIPYVDGGENQDLLDYRGLGVASMDYISLNNRVWLSADINPRKGWGDMNVTLGAGYKVSRASNQYIYLQFYNGYAEGLLDYNKFASYLRLGFCIKPDFYSVF